MTRQENYENEKMALDERFGTIDNRIIKIDLSMMKIICPRSNVQARSYVGLTNYLFRVYGTTVFITSQRRPTPEGITIIRNDNEQ